MSKKEIKPCEQCGYNRWKTKHKKLIGNFGSEYECRNCGMRRKVNNGI